MITVLSGCDFGHDKIQENVDGSLIFLGKRYIKLEKSDDIYFKYDYNNDGYYISKEGESWFSDFLEDGDYCEVSKDKYFIEDFDGEIYCREDKYKSVAERTENGFEPEKYLYTYEEYKMIVSSVKF